MVKSVLTMRIDDIFLHSSRFSPPTDGGSSTGSSTSLVLSSVLNTEGDDVVERLNKNIDLVIGVLEGFHSPEEKTKAVYLLCFAEGENRAKAANALVKAFAEKSTDVINTAYQSLVELLPTAQDEVLAALNLGLKNSITQVVCSRSVTHVSS